MKRYSVTARQKRGKPRVELGHVPIVGTRPDLSIATIPNSADGVGEEVRMSEAEGGVLAQRVRERMTELGLSQFRAAKNAGLQQDYVRDILRGRVRNPGAERLGKLALALECTQQFLLGEPEHILHFEHDGKDLLAGVQPIALESASRAVLLEVRHELMADTWRPASDVARRPLGREAASIPDEFSGREHWFEIVRDDSFKEYAPAGSLVQVVSVDDEEARKNLQHGHIVVAQRRIFEDDGNIHLVERSLRRVVHRYPDLGLWFLEKATGDEEQNLTDDVLRRDEAQRKSARPPIQAPIGPPTRAVHDALQKMRQTTKEEFEEALRSQERRRTRVMGLVVRVLTPMLKGAGFIAPATE